MPLMYSLKSKPEMDNFDPQRDIGVIFGLET